MLLMCTTSCYPSPKHNPVKSSFTSCDAVQSLLLLCYSHVSLAVTVALPSSLWQRTVTLTVCFMLLNVLWCLLELSLSITHIAQ